MNRIFYPAIAAGLIVSAVRPAMASIYSDDLGRCLVAKSTQADKGMLVRWMFAALSASPEVASISSVTPAIRADLNKQTAQLFGRLVFEDCRKESVQALKYDGSSAFEASFNLLGQVAARSLMTDPAVQASLSGFAGAIDKGKLGALTKEAGLPAPAPATSKP